MDAKHSPAPWTLEDHDGDFALMDADEGRVCIIRRSRYVDERDDPTQLANAHLIAAASDMAEALTAICLRIENDSLDAQTILNLARDALAKAEGV
jgi:hypothetical protein